MNKELCHFEEISRERWQELHKDKALPLTQEELNSIRSLNDTISLQEVEDIYLPLTKLIGIYKTMREHFAFSQSLFLQKKVTNSPFIIGISGSVAVGKSTTSRLLQILLSRSLQSARVEMVTTDGFLYPNAVLKEKDILHRKGFPESYHMELLLEFLSNMKEGKDFAIPIYSHEIYDIVPDRLETISAPDILIVEGINVFQSPKNHNLYISDYFDVAIYVDAEVAHIEDWYLNRFQTLLELAKQDPSNYYHRFTHMPKEEVLELAHNTWTNINLVNLKHYIEPTRHRADIILHKGESHQIDKIYLKK